MKNFNRLAVVFALTVPIGGNVGDAEMVAEKQPFENTEYINTLSLLAGNIATTDVAPDVSNLNENNLSVVDDPNNQNIDQSAEATALATRIGNQVQLSEPPPPPLPVEPIPIPNFNNWVRLAECESGGNWQINTGNGYYGGVQFDLSSWKAAGGLLFAIRPDFASMEEQMLIAENWLNTVGWGAWPACSRKLGLR